MRLTVFSFTNSILIAVECIKHRPLDLLPRKLTNSTTHRHLLLELDIRIIWAIAVQFILSTLIIDISDALTHNLQLWKKKKKINLTMSRINRMTLGKCMRNMRSSLHLLTLPTLTKKCRTISNTMIRNRKIYLFRIGMIDMYHDHHHHQIIICNFSISIKAVARGPKLSLP